MKKQIKKIALYKKTISNLNAAQMNRHVGGDPTYTRKDCSGNCTYGCTLQTCKGNTCNHKCGY